MEKAKDRLEALERIENFERNGQFDIDADANPEDKELLPNKIDYLRKKLSSKIKTHFAYKLARKVMNKLIKQGVLRVKSIEGIENFQNLKTGAVLTCNHFNALDTFAMQMCYDVSKHKKRKMFKVINERNYTNFPGLYGFFMRNCYSLPLSSNLQTMRKFISATNTILQRGDFILIYAEQAMWWNYRKPRPMKKSAFKMAVTNNVPVLPIFITLNDSETIGPDGFPIQEYTIHVGKPIEKDESKSINENIEYMRDENFKFNKEVYEKAYNQPLTYLTEEDKLPNEVKKFLK